MAPAKPKSDGGSLPPGLVEAVAIGNLKDISEQPAMLANLAYSNTVSNTNLSQQNAVANQQAMNELGISIVGAGVNLLGKAGAHAGKTPNSASAKQQADAKKSSA